MANVASAMVSESVNEESGLTSSGGFARDTDGGFLFEKRQLIRAGGPSKSVIHFDPRPWWWQIVHHQLPADVGMDPAPNGPPRPPLDSRYAGLFTLGMWTECSVCTAVGQLSVDLLMTSVVTDNVTTSPVGGTVPTAAVYE